MIDAYLTSQSYTKWVMITPFIWIQDVFFTQHLKQNTTILKTASDVMML